METATRPSDGAELHDRSRQSLIELLERRGVRDRRVLAAMAAVPREQFVAPGDVARAYCDCALAIDAGQTISQPYVVALMLEVLQLQPDDRVLEIGTGSGYSAAVLSRIVARVFSVERLPELAAAARDRLDRLGGDNIELRCGDGSLGWPEHAPYRAIVVTAAAPRLPPTLLAQLAIGGHLIAPIGHRDVQHLVLVTRRAPDQLDADDLGRVAFVPLIGEHAWPER